MNISDYKFEVGDEVVTITGVRGKIIYICDCDECKKRGFYEPTWKADNMGEQDYITDEDAKEGFQEFYKIGRYRFHDFDRGYLERAILTREYQLKTLNEQLKVMDEIEQADKAEKGDC